MLCAIWYHLYNLKNVKNTHGEVILLLKLQASALPWEFFTFFKPYKWYQIVQSILYKHVFMLSQQLLRRNVTELNVVGLNFKLNICIV